MNLVNDFMEFAKEQQLNEEDIFTEKAEGYTVISFGEEGEVGVIYNVALVLYDDNNTTEIYVRKAIEVQNLLDVLQKVNELNFEYRGINFFLRDGLVTGKSYVEAHGDIEVVLKQMLQTMRVASEEFSKFN